MTQPQRTLPAASLSAALAATTGEHIPALRILEHALPDRPNHLPTGPAAWPFAWVWARVLAGALAKAAIDPRWGWAQMLRIDALVRHLGRVSNHPGWPALVAADLARVHDLMRPARSGSQLGSWRVAVSALSGVPGLRYEWAYAQLRLAEALLAHGERRAARLALTSSGAAIDELGAAALAPTARRIAAAGRVTLRPASSRPEVLTPREREVLALVAAGHTNAEISRALVIAAKTTSVHVSSILAKLGVSSRTQAAAWAHAHPEEMGTRD